MEVMNILGHGLFEKPYEKVVVDTKTIERITDHEMGQMLNYLKITDLQFGMLINFKHSKLEWKRVVL